MEAEHVPVFLLDSADSELQLLLVKQIRSFKKKTFAFSKFLFFF